MRKTQWIGNWGTQVLESGDWEPLCVYMPMAYYRHFDFRFWRLLLLLLFDIERSTWFVYFVITSIIFPNEGVKYMGNPKRMSLMGMPINCVKCWFIEMYTTIYECIILIWNFIHNRFIRLFGNYSFEICFAEEGALMAHFSGID